MDSTYPLADPGTPEGADQGIFTELNIGSYRITSSLGKGTFGLVYLAYQPFLDREVALKILRANVSTNPKLERHFMEEARTIAKLRHPNIVTVHEFGTTTTNGRTLTYIVMEYLPGETLYGKLNDGPLSVLGAVEITEQLAAALDYANARHIIHRDLKPANIMFSEQGQPVIVDFGLAGLVEMTTAEDSPKNVLAGAMTGTPVYMSPEQAQGKVCGPSTDQYSLALIAYEMLAGKRAYSGDTVADLMRAKLKSAPLFLTEIAPNLPRAVDEVVQRATARDPEARYATSTAFANALSEALLPDRLPGRVVTITDPVQAAQLQSARQSLEGFMWGLVLLTFMVILITSALFLRGFQNSEPFFIWDGIVASSTIHDGFRDVIGLWPNSPAQIAGVQVGDLIRDDISYDRPNQDGNYSINGEPRSAYPANWQPHEGDVIVRTLIRNGQPVEVHYPLQRSYYQLIVSGAQLPPAVLAFCCAIWFLRRWGAEPGVQIYTMVELAGSFTVVASGVSGLLGNFDTLALAILLPLFLHLILVFPRPLARFEGLYKRLWVLYLPLPIALLEFLFDTEVFNRFNFIVYAAYSVLIILAIVFKWGRSDSKHYRPMWILINSFVMVSIAVVVTAVVANFDNYETVKTFWGGNDLIFLAVSSGIIAFASSIAVVFGAIGFHRVQLMLGRSDLITAPAN